MRFAAVWKGSLRERFVRQGLGRHQPRQRVPEQVLVRAVVEPEFKFGQIRLKVLG